MTRISAGVKPIELCDRMLIAEHREIKRIPNAIKSGKAVVKDIPTRFTLGTGHVKFFYDKLSYLKARYESLHAECLERGFDVQDFTDAFDNIPQELMGDWEECDECRQIVLERIWERLATMRPSDIRHYGEIVEIDNFYNL